MTAAGTRADRPFSYPTYRTLWFTNVATNVGVLIQTVGASWLMVRLGATPQRIALVQAAASLPLVLISPLSGAIADNVDRRTVMIAAQAVLAAASLLLAWLTSVQLAGPWVVLACIFLVGSCIAFNGPAWMASVGDVLPRSAIPDAVVFNAVGLNLARSVGPALGGLVAGAFGAAANFAINAALSVSLIAALYCSRFPPRPVSGRRAHLLATVLAGVRFAAGTLAVRSALFRAFMFALTGSGLQALLPLIARDVLAGGSAIYGLLFAAFGAGALCGALASARLRDRFTPDQLATACVIVSAVATFGSAWSEAFAATAVIMAWAGGAWVAAFSILNVAVQLASPRDVVARALSLYQMSVFAGVALGSWLSGLIADHLGVQVSLSMAAAASFACLPLTRLAPLPSAWHR